MAIYVFLGLRHSFIADFSLLSAAMSMHFGTFNSCFHAKMTNYYSTLLIVFFNSCLSFAFYAVAIVMPARPPEPGKRKQHKLFCHRSSRAAMPSSMVVSRLPVKSARHTTERNGFLSFTCAVGARARSPAAAALCTALACASACAYIANIPCHNILL